MRRRSLPLFAIFFLTILIPCSLLACSTNNAILPGPTATPDERMFLSLDDARQSTLTPFQPLPTNTPTLTPTATITPTATKKPKLPSHAKIENISGQFQAYPLDCEARAAVDWAAYFGVSIGEMEFQNRLPTSDNPEKGFVGSYKGGPGQIPPGAYGVHAAPVANLLREFKLKAYAVKKMSLDRLKQEIAAGRPVILWVISSPYLGEPIPYKSKDNKISIVAYNEHAAMVIGYTKDTITILDGAWVYDKSTQSFLDNWAVLGNMAVIGSKP